MATPVIKVLYLMANYGHDPTETAVPYTAFKKAGFEVRFATEQGKTPQCDKKMLEGLTQKLLGAAAPVLGMYETMSQDSVFAAPLSWSTPSLAAEFNSYSLIFLPGGHDAGVRQLLDSETVHGLLAGYFPLTTKPSNKTVGAVCHGVLALGNAKWASGESKGKSLLYDVKSTALPAGFESMIFWGTRLWLGDYYKTYGAGSENVEQSVKKMGARWQGSLGPSPFVIEDEKFNYISARFPGDVEKMAERLVETVKANAKSGGT